MKIHESQLPCPEGELRAALDNYKAALTEHALTEGVPAPLPAYEILRNLVRIQFVDGQPVAMGDFTIEKTPEPEPIEPSAPRPVTVVTMRQARLALLAAGLLDAVDAAIAGMPGNQGAAARIEWEYATTLDRSWPLVTALAGALGLDDAQLDALFEQAARL